MYIYVYAHIYNPLRYTGELIILSNLLTRVVTLNLNQQVSHLFKIYLYI